MYCGSMELNKCSYTLLPLGDMVRFKKHKPGFEECVRVSVIGTENKDLRMHYTNAQILYEGWKDTNRIISFVNWLFIFQIHFFLGKGHSFFCLFENSYIFIMTSA